MKKEILIVSIILIVIIIINIICQKHLSNSIKDINMQLEEISDIFRNNYSDKSFDDNSINNKIKSVSKKWDEYEKRLSLYIEHDELEKVDRVIVLIRSNIECRNYEKVESDLKECIFILNHIKNKQTFDISNLF